MNLSFKLFLEDEGRYVFGPGRVELLRAVAELGSLRKAAQKLGMSYRWAWGRLRDAEKALGVPLLESGGPGGGAAKSLTAEAHEVLAWYGAVEKELLGVVDRAIANQPAFLRSSNVSRRGKTG